MPTHHTNQEKPVVEHIAFMGGGNMASAIISGLLHSGFDKNRVDVVEPFDEARARLQTQFNITAHPTAAAFLERASTVIWAVKPQTFKEAAQQAHAFTCNALHISVAAGIRSDSIARWLGVQRIIRTMPNTPALIGKGITAMVASPTVTAADRQHAERIVGSTGEWMWLEREEQLDAVTALSGSGPAYMFYFMEAMAAAGAQMGLPHAQAYRLAVATFLGAGALADASDEPPEVLRQRVTSKGGTTYAAISSMEASGVKARFTEAILAAQKRAAELGYEFGGQ
jgi:pyrroline-5-carboxylate reductase